MLGVYVLQVDNSVYLRTPIKGNSAEVELIFLKIKWIHNLTKLSQPIRLQ